ncbi:MAG: metal-dependent hydrolase [Patescibacteria group bacterium]
MYSTAHLAAGLIIGKLTGDYPTAIIGAVAIDLDHLIPHVKNKIIFNLKKMLEVAKSTHESSRSYLHSFLALIVLTGVIAWFNLKVGMVFCLGYLSHFLLDAIDDDDFYPLFPYLKFNTRGFIGYYSKAEFIFTIILFGIYFVI